MAAVCSSSVMRRPASVTEKPADCSARAAARPIPLPAPVTMATLPCPVLFGIEAIVDVPMCGLSWLDSQVMVSLGADSRARRPEVKSGNGIVPGLLDPDSRPCILDHDVVIRR